MVRSRPVGTITRGTTNPNRLRRCDRWLTTAQRHRLLGERAVAVDLGYGAAPWTTVELFERLRVVAPAIEVVGVEIDPERVALAQRLARPGLSFRRGGFEVPVEGEVDIVRAFNVLRQYGEAQVPDAWTRLRERLSPTGIVVDGTCDEIGRLASWVVLDRHGPISLTVSYRLRGLEQPGIVAERLPKALIHRNVPGEPVHRFLTALDLAWARHAPLASYGTRQRFVATAAALHADGWPIMGGRSRWRLGELSVAWDAVAPTGWRLTG